MSKTDDQAGLMKGKVQVGDSAPDFTLLDQSGTPVCLGDFLGKKHIVLYFYPKDNTSLCTEEAQAFRDSYEVFKNAGEPRLHKPGGAWCCVPAQAPSQPGREVRMPG